MEGLAARATLMPPPWPRLRDVASQALLFLAVLALFWWLGANAADNMARLGKAAGFPIGESPISYDPATASYGRAILVGLLNTLKVAAIGCVLATLLGVL